MSRQASGWSNGLGPAPLIDPFDWLAPLPDLTASFAVWNESYWAKQSAWKRRLRPILEAWQRSLPRRWLKRLRSTLRPPRHEPNWCTTFECSLCNPNQVGHRDV